MACGTGCSTGCSKLSITYDWLENMLPPGNSESDNIYEIRFKSTRKGFFKNIHALPVANGDYVAVESDRGFDIGIVSMGGELARLQMKKKRIEPRFALDILRFATAPEIERLEQFRQLENEILVKTRAIIYTLNLDMKLSDIEFQGDGAKAIFYYTAEHRVDFRDLIRLLAAEFKLRIEMRQIGLRQEAGMLGGIGSCGRELCCSTWLTDFKTVNTSAARYQNISLNPSKITGQCGRLKCCLNYELETYLDALKDFPDVKEIHTELGVAYLQKTDVFKRKLWYSYSGGGNWVMLTVEQVVELYNMNQRGILPLNFAEYEEKTSSEKSRTARPSNRHGEPTEYVSDFVDVVGQSNLHERLAKRSSRIRSRKLKNSSESQRPQKASPSSENNPLTPPARRRTDGNFAKHNPIKDANSNMRPTDRRQRPADEKNPNNERKQNNERPQNNIDGNQPPKNNNTQSSSEQPKPPSMNPYHKKRSRKPHNKNNNPPQP